MAIYTFPSHKPFLTQLANHVSGHSCVPRLLLLPSKRACQTLRNHLQSTMESPPQIIALGELVEHAYTQNILRLMGREDLAKPSISTMKRQLMLTRLCMAASEKQEGYSLSEPQAMELAGALASLLDEFQRQEIPFHSVQNLVPDEYADHWQRILHFLNIIAVQWPRILEAEEGLDPIAHRNQVYQTILTYWQQEGAEGITIAGSTASNKVVAEMMQWVAAQDTGEVILPALPLTCDDTYWQGVSSAHPYFYPRRFLEQSKQSLADARLLDDGQASTCPPARIELLHKSFIPAELASRWKDAPFEAEQMVKVLAGLECVEVANDLEQIRHITALCKANLDKSICIVSEQKTFSRKLERALAGTGIASHASESYSLQHNDWAIFFTDILQAASNPAHPVHMLVVLKHDAFQTGDEALERELAEWLEHHILRQGNAYASLEQLTQAICAYDGAEEITPQILTLLERYQQMIEPLQALLKYKKGFSELLMKHAECIAHPSLSQEFKPEERQELLNFLGQLSPQTVYLGQVDASEYGAILDALMGRELHMRDEQGGSNITILPSEEARLETADIVIIADFNEGIWPAEASVNPWLSRPMQRRLGFDLDHMRASRMGHDFLMLAHASELILIRPLLKDNMPTLPSRWLERVRLLLKAQGHEGGIALQDVRVDSEGAEAVAMDQSSAQNSAQSPVQLAQPAPTPPVQMRPQRLSLSDLELLQRDPYSIYAKHITALKPVGELIPDSNQALYGTILHRILELFCRAHPKDLPHNAHHALQQLAGLLDDTFKAYSVEESLAVLWRPRLLAALDYYYKQECQRRPTIQHVLAEVSLSKTIDINGQPFTIYGRADRVEIYEDNTAALIDYKTGGVPLMRDVHSFVACQLPFGAWLVEHMFAKKRHNVHIDKVEYWRFSKDGIEVKAPFTNMREQQSCEHIEAHLRQLLSHYASVSTAYTARPDEAIAPNYSDYLQLERYAEWG